mmetsp:Transcript_43414/g.130223  ORF Transcript_43414/g.130223 Transcript_43414/m.130223 type:complete len:203 (-) Transcript_43414:1839-2447(-)
MRERDVIVDRRRVVADPALGRSPHARILDRVPQQLHGVAVRLVGEREILVQARTARHEHRSCERGGRRTRDVATGKHRVGDPRRTVRRRVLHTALLLLLRPPPVRRVGVHVTDLRDESVGRGVVARAHMRRQQVPRAELHLLHHAVPVPGIPEADLEDEAAQPERVRRECDRERRLDVAVEVVPPPRHVRVDRIVALAVKQV